MRLPHTFNLSPGSLRTCTCGEVLVHPIHPHRPTQVRHGRCDCGAPVDAICHITTGDR